MRNLGSLKKVNLRDIWAREDKDFTIWLAKENNISILLDEIGVTAENIKVEDKAGKYSCDITGDEIETNKKIIIENQLEKTDHKHLGQLLTYASSFDASIIIWVVAKANDEHKQAIEWFNKHMTEKISFFLVRIELWQIGGSEPAPKFNIVVEPNDFQKIHMSSANASKELTKGKLLKLRFWDGLISYSDNNPSKLSITRKARAQHWYTVAVGKSGVHIAFLHNTRTNQVSVELYFHRKDVFDKFYNNKDKFEEICSGQKIDWLPLESKKASRILTHLNCDVNDEEIWEKCYEWFLNTGEKFLSAFRSIY